MNTKALLNQKRIETEICECYLLHNDHTIPDDRPVHYKKGILNQLKRSPSIAKKCYVESCCNLLVKIGNKSLTTSYIVMSE